MDQVRITFRGGRELARMLRTLPEAVREELLARALLAGGDVLGMAVRDRAPRGIRRRRPSALPLAETVRVRLLEADRAHAAVSVGIGAPQGHLLEYGHNIVPRGPSRGTKVSVTRISRTGRARSEWETVGPTQARRRELRRALKARRAAGAIGHVAARPFMRPAADESKDAIVRRMAAVLGAGIAAHVRQRAGAPA